MPFFAMVALTDVSLFPYRQPVPSGLGSQVQLNVEALCQELTANIVKLEKVSRSFPSTGATWSFLSMDSKLRTIFSSIKK